MEELDEMIGEEPAEELREELEMIEALMMNLIGRIFGWRHSTCVFWFGRKYFGKGIRYFLCEVSPHLEGAPLT